MDFTLTNEEQKELSERPVTHDFVNFTESQLNLRKIIAKKFFEHAMSNLEIGDSLRKIYEKKPIYKFYESDGLPKRAYGVGILQDGTEIVDTATAMLMLVNDTIGGTNMNELKEVDNWTKDHLSRIMSCGSPGIFIDPIGFILLLE